MKERYSHSMTFPRLTFLRPRQDFFHWAHLSQLSKCSPLYSKGCFTVCLPYAPILPSAPTAGVLVARPLESSAAQKINKPLGQEAFRRIRDARQILDRVDVPLRGRNFDEVQVRKLLSQVATGSANFANQPSKDFELLVQFELPWVEGACSYRT